MSKTHEKTENRLEMFFMTKDQKQCVFRVCSKNSCQNAFNQSKLAHKQPNGQIEQ